MRSTTKRCPHCMEKIHAEAKKCKHCGSMLTKEPANVIYDNVTLIRKALANRYVIQEPPIGEGGMAIVFKAIQKNLGRPVALKVLRPNLIYDHEFLNRLHREAKVAAKLQHPNIITIYDVCHDEQYYSDEQGIENNTHFISMELLDGMDLNKRILLYGPFSVDELVPIMIQITDALEYAHGKNVVHRDVKSSNIFLNRDGRVILMDFGIAYDATATQLTRKGESFMTPEFASPEQVEGKEIDARTDIWSFGIVMYQALTGISPFKGENLTATILKIANEPLVPISRIKKVPQWIEDAISACLIKDKTKRIQNASELKEILLRKKPLRKIIQQKQEMRPLVPQRKAEVEFVQSSQASNKTPPKIRTRKIGNKISTITIVLSTVALIIFVAIIVLITQPKNTPVVKKQYTVEVPDVTGMNIDAAKRILEDSGLKVNFGDADMSQQVIKQNPSVGVKVNRGTLITLTVAVSNVVVPDVIGLSPDDAGSEIKVRGLSVIIVRTFAGTDKSQQVIKQDPKGGEKRKKGAIITLTVGE